MMKTGLQKGPMKNWKTLGEDFILSPLNVIYLRDKLNHPPPLVNLKRTQTILIQTSTYLWKTLWKTLKTESSCTHLFIKNPQEVKIPKHYLLGRWRRIIGPKSKSTCWCECWQNSDYSKCIISTISSSIDSLVLRYEWSCNLKSRIHKTLHGEKIVHFVWPYWLAVCRIFAAQTRGCFIMEIYTIEPHG